MAKKKFLLHFGLAMAIFAVTAVIHQNVALAQAAVPQEELTAAEIELDALCSEMNSAFERYDERQTIVDPKEKSKFEKERDPRPAYFERLAEFERRHRGTHTGLMALYQLSIRNGLPGDPGFGARRTAIQVAPHYHHLDEFILILRSLGGGASDGTIKDAYEKAISSPRISVGNRDMAKLRYAEWFLELREGKRVLEKRLEKLRADEELNAEKIHFWEQWLEQIHSAGDLDLLEKRVLTLLEEAVNSEHGIHIPTFRSSKKSRFLIYSDVEENSERFLISESAKRLLYKARYLIPGKKMREFEVVLNDGQPWRLADQRGKVVIIQFSYEGCRPCAQMYPELGEIQKKFADKVSVLTIMQDTHETVAESVKSHKMTWSVCPDGKNSPLVNEWSVFMFPTTYVVAPNGFIVEHDPLVVSYTDLVAQLLDR